MPNHKKYLSLEPQRVNSQTWYYEENSGILIYSHVTGKPAATVIQIPWRLLRKSVQRADKK